MVALPAPNALQMFPWRPKEHPTARLKRNKEAAELVAYGTSVEVA